ncbi:hypothetical protein C8F04DRAFT_1210668 [Mycena alexandri]|uniref:C2H2-type domain-containing protein n=1 Tax=Mycena alexandri TaxID=1745969 RepID=A0AAD6SVQ1_9AGAR|nr:hypothetical protein C8F04DRAFT_1210668 [Mycena alexandri]
MDLPFGAAAQAFVCPRCPKVCATGGGLTRHFNTKHREFTPASEGDDEHRHRTDSHPILNALPCDAAASLHGQTPNSWHPFESRSDFDFAHFHFVEEQSSARSIATALNLWAAQVLKYGAHPPWKNAKDLYSTIDSIQHGDAPWKVHKICYRASCPFHRGPLPPGLPPKWMTETYELCTRNIRTVLQNQLATGDFKDKFNYSPYRQFDGESQRVWSNLLSADWAWKQADLISEDEDTHGGMFVPVIGGSDKTTVSVATGHQEFHPFYSSPGNLTGVARRAHGNGVLPVAFLPIAKTTKRQRKTPAFQKFVRQMYHACLARVYEPLKAGMTTPEVVRCPDGHFRRAIYGIGPYIADYPEQVWLACVVQNWCPKCDARPTDLDAGGARMRSHRKTDFLITCFDPGTLWDDFGIRSDVQPFTHDFLRAEIYELLSPDLLHQIIKGTFKDHLVEWVMQYLHEEYGESRALEIIADIDHRISAIPSFPGLRRFPDGRDFHQWTGDDSKALMKVYLSAIAGHVPSEMVKCVAAFLDFCYLVRRNALTTDTLDDIDEVLDRFHTHRDIFIATGVRVSISLPRQHSMLHYRPSIILFGSPNGLCSSITESKHIKAVKEPWRRSSRYQALGQMLRVLTRLDRLAALRSIFAGQGMMEGTAASYAARMMRGEVPQPPQLVDEIDDDDDVGDSPGPKSSSSTELAVTPSRLFPKDIAALAAHINQPRLPELIRRFLYDQLNPDSDIPSAHVPLDSCPPFSGRLNVFLSAVARFYAPSDLCGAGSMYRERILSHDTVFVVTDVDQPRMQGMVVGRALLFFSFTYRDTHYPCALVHWYSGVGNQPDDDTGMWVVAPECEQNGRPSLAVVHLDCIARGAHLLPIYGSTFVAEDFHFSYSLDPFRAFFVSRFADHHTHKFLYGK